MPARNSTSSAGTERFKPPAPVDCHWRFDERTAAALNEAAARFGVYWIECPLPEVDGNIPALARLRGQCNGLGMRQAGLETSIGWAGFRRYCEGAAYDAVMPDTKYAGGIHEAVLRQHADRPMREWRAEHTELPAAVTARGACRRSARSRRALRRTPAAGG